MGQTTLYSMHSVNANLDGIKIEGLAGGDEAIKVEYNSDVSSLTMGADGSGVISNSTDESVMITLSLQHGSPTHKQLKQTLAQQRTGAAKGFKFDVLDTISGEGGVADECYIKTAPVDSKGVNATNREWVLHAAQYVPNI